MDMTVIDVSDQDFEAEVIERSRTVPVVVDFWAEWCEPCRQLGPLLEREAQRNEGQVVLAKLDTDANQGLSQAFGIQGIPAVKAFKDAAIVDEFVGVKSPEAVQRFFAGLIPSEADGLAAAGDEASLRRALELDPGRADAAVSLATLLHARGDTTEALDVLEPVTGSFAADGLGARIRLEQDPDIDLGAAWAAADAGDTGTAVDILLDAIATPGTHTDDLRQAIVGLLDGLGVDHPLARDARRRLASALY
jgi:putative thioredoxin